MKRRLNPTGLLLLSLGAALTSLSGCGDDGLGTRYKVSGKVTYKGAPVEKGLVSFISSDPDGRGATGLITDGTYTMTTQEPGDGAFAGTYSVAITSKTPNLEKAAADAQKKGNTSAYIPPDFTGKAGRDAPNAIPDKYATLSPSNPLKAEVKAQSNTIDFELTD